jgi:1-acyl-sn-glycerol-3-phosphate acyltransferase
MKLLRTIYWLVVAFFATLLGAFCLPVFWFFNIVGRKCLRQKLAYRYAHWWGKVVLDATGSKVTVKGSENIPSGPVVFMANHLSAFDTMLILGYLDKPLAFVAKKELARLPVINPLMRQIGCLYLDRDDIRQAVRVINRAADQARNGLSMVIFPEGTRSLTGEVGEFKSGSMKLAMKAGVPILPVYIQGTRHIYEGNGRRIEPSQIFLQMMPPILPPDYQELGSNRLAKVVRDKVEEARSIIALALEE